MKRILWFPLLILLATSGFSLAVNAEETTAEWLYQVEDETHAVTLAADYDITLIRVSAHGVALFNARASAEETLLAAGFHKNGVYTTAQPPWARPKSDEDPYLKDQYALEMMQTLDAWELTEGSADVTIAIIDTGIDINHPEFDGRISLLSYNTVTEETGLAAVADDIGHGTMVAGIVGAIKDNGHGIAGIVQAASLLIIKANQAGKNTFSDSAVIDGIYYAVDNGADIINLSLGGTHLNALTETALLYAHDAGVIVTAAAGNDGSDDIFYPAGFDTTISVSSVDEDRAFSSFSNYGDYIDISAPGENIVTTTRNSGYAEVFGTSFAAPQIAGVVGLLLSYIPDIPFEEITLRLYMGAMDEGAPGKDPYFGYGIANTLNALTLEFAMITFETYDAASIEPMMVVQGEPFTPPDEPHLADHVFEGWFLDEDFESLFETGDIVDGDMTLYANFCETLHTVTFVTAGSSVSPLIVDRGDTFELPESTLENHVFIGWMVDEARTELYEPEPLWGDLTLYAKFEAIVYWDITRIVDGVLWDVMTVEAGTLYVADPLEKTGHGFDGWYVDDAYETPYEPVSVEEDISLYARFLPDIHIVTFVTDGNPIAPIEVEYGETFELPEAVKDDHYFIGWYLDEPYATPYVLSPVVEDLTLYARFAEEAYLITYYVDDAVYATQYALADEPLEPMIPEKYGHAFVVWHTDENLSMPYEGAPITENLSLYAEFDILTFTVRFLNYDDTPLFETVVAYGESVDAIAGPEKPSSESFHYAFSHWSATTDYVTEDMDITPVYDRTFRPESVSLNPGVDTVEKGGQWHDASISLADETLDVGVSAPVDTDKAGRYIVVYSIYDGEILLHQLKRYVRVTRATPDVVITLTPGIATLVQGSEYVEPGAVASQGDVTVTGSVDVDTPGVYIIVYEVEIDGVVIQKTRYVHVLDEPMAQTTPAFLVQAKRKEDDDHVA